MSLLCLLAVGCDLHNGVESQHVQDSLFLLNVKTTNGVHATMYLRSTTAARWLVLVTDNPATSLFFFGGGGGVYWYRNNRNMGATLAPEVTSGGTITLLRHIATWHGS
jgi:hypothetical protein